MNTTRFNSSELYGVLLLITDEREVELVKALDENAALEVRRRCVDEAELLGAAISRIGQIAVLAEGANPYLLDQLNAAGVHPVLVSPDESVNELVKRVANVAAGISQANPDDAWEFGLLPGMSDSDFELQQLNQSDSDVEVPVPEGAQQLSDKEPPEEGESGLIITVSGTVGSVGRSTIAIHLGALLARRGYNTLLVDADTVAPVLAQRLALSADGSGVGALAALGIDADPLSLADSVQQYASELDLLSGLGRPGRWRELTGERLRRILMLARKHYDIVVVDTCGLSEEAEEEAIFGPSRFEAVVAAIETADQVIFVGDGDLIGMDRLLSALPTLNELTETYTLVVNRVGEETAGRLPDMQVQRTLSEFGGTRQPVTLPVRDAELRRATLIGDLLPDTDPLCGKLADVLRQLGFPGFGERSRHRGERRTMLPKLKRSRGVARHRAR